MAELETYEWSDCWWDKPQEKGKRILLVGDSITKGYRKYVKEQFGDTMLVDMYATSKAIDNPLYTKELFYVIEQNKYELVHFNNGLHGFHMDITDYNKYYYEIVKKVLEHRNVTKMILALSTPITEIGNRGKFEIKNNIVLARNRAAERIAKEYNLFCGNLYSAVEGNVDIRLDDGFHYNENGYRLLGGIVAENMKMCF